VSDVKTILPLTVAALLLCACPSATAPLPEKFLHGDLVAIDTSLGLIRLKLFPKQAPITVANFLRYVDDRHYEGTIFHRVIPGFMIQGGGHDPDLAEKKTRDPIKNEGGNGLSNKRGTIAVARRVDPDSGTGQFFINLKDNPQLDSKPNQPGYCVFGEVVEGMDIVDQIAKVQTAARGMLQDVPVQPVLIKAIRRGPQ
jgi:cyclophilin family peptidyl-prolyl cis-trans isomerase